MPLVLRNAIKERKQIQRHKQRLNNLTTNVDWLIYINSVKPFGVDIDNGVGAEFGFLL